MIVIEFHICCCVLNFIKTDLRFADLTTFKTADICHLEFHWSRNGFIEKLMS